MVYSQWKQRLYAFLLRRVLGPYLSVSSLQKLHESIDVSLHEGKFILRDVDLNTVYLTEVLSSNKQQQQRQSRVGKSETSDKDDNVQPVTDTVAVSVKRARIRKLQIHLTLEDVQESSQKTTNNAESQLSRENNSGSSTGTTRSSSSNSNISSSSSSSVAWRAMKLGQQGTDSAGGISVRLLAHAEIDGCDIELEPERRRHDDDNDGCSPSRQATTASTATPSTVSNETPSLTVGMIASYVEAAMSSLRLGIQVRDLRVKLCSNSSSRTRDDDNNCYHWVEFHLAGAQYHDVNDFSTSQRQHQQQQSRYRMTLHKAIDFSGITFRTGTTESVQTSSSSTATNETCLNDDSVAASTVSSVIAKTEGSGQIALRVFECYNNHSASSLESESADGSSNETMNAKVDASSLQAPPPIQQDLDVSLNQRLSISVDKTSIQSLLEVSTSFLYRNHDGLPTEDTAVQLSSSSTTTTRDGNPREERASASGQHMNDDIIADGEDLNAMTGIMKQYAEARQLAERNEMRGGILIPSTAFEEDGADDNVDGLVSFDAFFDANDHSFSLYQSRLEQSVLVTSSADDDSEQAKFVHTKLRCHLQHCGIKVVFVPSSDNVSPSDDFRGSNRHWHGDEYLLFTLEDVSLSSSLSHSESDISLNAMHFEIEDSFRDQSIIPSRGHHPPPIEIGNVLRFERGFGDDDPNGGNATVAEAPCFTIHILMQHSTKSTCTADLILEPVEFTLCTRTFSNVMRLISQLDFGGESSRMCSTQVSNIEEIDKRKTWRMSACCPSVSIVMPLGLNALRGTQGGETYSSLFDRCAYVLPHVPVSRRLSFGVTLDELSLLHESRTVTSPPEQTDQSSSSSSDFGPTTTATCDRLLCFVTSPRDSASGMQRADIIASSGHAPLSVKHRATADKSLFPTVPPLSSFKARQEDDDSDDEDIFSSEFSSFAQNPIKLTARASDPQNMLQREAAKCSSTFEIYLPELVGDLTQEEATSLSRMVLFELSGLGSEKDESESPSVPPAESNDDARLYSTGISISVDQITLAAHDIIEDEGTKHWVSFTMMAEAFMAHAVLPSPSRLRTARVLSHELNFFEAFNLIRRDAVEWENVPSIRDRCDVVRRRTFRREDSVITPIFYRSQLFPPLSLESPAVLLDILMPEKDIDETNVHFTVYNMTHRCDVDSRWLYRLKQLLRTRHRNDKGLERASPVLSASRKQRVVADTDPSLIKIFVSLADCTVDYTTPKTFSTPSRMIVRLGDLRLSSNLVLPLVRRQACRVSLGDLTILLCNTRYDHRFENARLARASTVFARDDLMASKKGTTSDDVLRDMNLITVLTLDAVDLMFAFILPANDPNENAAVWKDASPGDAAVTVGVNLGMLSLYGCKDSFECFTSTLGELQLYLTSVDEETMEAMKYQTLAVQPGEEESSDKFFDSNTGTNVEGAELETGGTVQSPSSPNHSFDLPDSEDFILGGDDWATVENEWSKTASLAPDEEQAARWYSEDDSRQSDSPPVRNVRVSAVHLDPSGNVCPKEHCDTNPKLQIIANHFPMKPVADPFSNSMTNVAKYAGTTVAPATQARVLVRDAHIRCRFFDGYDWPQLMKRPHVKNGFDFVIEPVAQEKIEAEQKDLSEAISNQMTDAQVEKAETKAKLLGELLEDNASAADDDEREEHTFRAVPLPEERGALLESLAHRRRLARRMNKFLQVTMSGFKMRLDALAESTEHRLASCIDVTMADFFVAETISTSKPVKLLGEWFNETEHPRDTLDGLIMMKMVTWHPQFRVTPDNEIENDESHVTLQVLPLRCNIDQRAVRFAIAFFSSDNNHNDSDQTKQYEWAVGRKEIPPPLFQSFKVRPCKLKVNYTPVKVNVEALREGSYVELINISPLIDMVITLQQVHLKGLVGFGPNIRELLSRWIEDVCATQMYKFVANARPFQPISSVGESAANNLIVIPWEAYKRGDKVGRAMRTGATSFAGSVAYETLNTGAKLTGLAAQALSSSSSASIGRGRHGSRSNRNCVAAATTSVEVTGNSSSMMLPSPYSSSFLPSRPNETPRGIGDTANHALESLARGLETANYKIVIVPYREYQRRGTRGALTSVVRGIPIAIAAPVGAATEALSYTLLGARNQIRPDQRKEEEASQRGLLHDL